MQKEHIQLSNHQKILGIKCAFENAKALFDEACILDSHCKWARATALFILGIEELTKVELIGETFSFRDVKDWQRFNKKFGSHTSKLKLADNLSLQITYRNEIELNSELKEILSGRNFDSGKQRCFYINYSKETGWQNPLTMVKKEDAEYCKYFLQRLLRNYESLLSKSHNELVEIVKQMKKVVSDEQVKASLTKMSTDIQKRIKKLKRDL